MRTSAVLKRTMAVVAATAAGVVAVPAAAQAAPGPWSTTYQNASASGTSVRVTTYPGTTVTGQLTVTADRECYRAQFYIQDDFYGREVTLADQCGKGTTSFKDTDGGLSSHTTFAVRLCRVVNGAITTCGYHKTI